MLKYGDQSGKGEITINYNGNGYTNLKIIYKKIETSI